MFSLCLASIASLGFFISHRSVLRLKDSNLFFPLKTYGMVLWQKINDWVRPGRHTNPSPKRYRRNWKTMTLRFIISVDWKHFKSIASRKGWHRNNKFVFPVQDYRRRVNGKHLMRFHSAKVKHRYVIGAFRRIASNDARMILRRKLRGQRQTESQELQTWTAVSTLLGLVSTM